MQIIYDHWFKTCLFIATAGFWLTCAWPRKDK